MSTQYVTDLQGLHHQITIAEASALIARFQANRQGIINGDFSDLDPFSNCQTFDLVQVQHLVNQAGCVGLRIYFGLYGDEAPNDNLKNKLVFVLCGVDENGNDLDLAPGTAEDGQIILEDGHICPPICPAPSQINNL